MRTTLTRNLAIGFVVLMALLLGSSAASYISIRNLLSSTEWVNHTFEVMGALDQVVSPVKEAEAGQRGYLITGDPYYLQNFEENKTSALSAIETVRKLTVDNPGQQVNVDSLSLHVNRKFNRLQQLINSKKTDNTINVEDLKEGKIYMDNVLTLVRKMKADEQSLLDVRTGTMNRFATFTPVMIIIASILAILLAIFFYIRVRNDIYEKAELQESLEVKDRQLARRIDLIESLAEKISAGDYSIRINDDEKDTLGSLALSLNKMTERLEYSFRQLSDKEWLQTGVSGLNETMAGELSIEVLSGNIIRFLAEYTNSQVGSFYMLQREGILEFTNGFAISPDPRNRKIGHGEGIVGQCLANEKEILVSEIPEGNFLISFASAQVKPRNIIAFPVFFEGSLIAVVELGTLYGYTEKECQFLRNGSANIGIALNTSKNRVRLQELLEETQAQSEELQAQHSELEYSNAELEVQSEKLQASEEELKVQQEELLQTNRELEERTKLLEERAQLIIERNFEIQRKAEELAVSTKYKSEFLANMSHELRTPLNSILLLSKLMAENIQDNLNPDQIEYAQVIQSSGNNLLELIDEILDLSKIEAGKMQLEYAETSIAEIADDIKRLFLPVAHQKQLEFSVILDAGLPTLMETDKGRLEQVLKNLLSNAFKFTHNGYVRLTIAKAAKNESFISFMVSDSGIGISKEKQEIIFEAFQQADGSTRRKYGGTGLGLSISRELTRLLEGEMMVSSEPGTGSTFTLLVPVSRDTVRLNPNLSKETLVEFQRELPPVISEVKAVVNLPLTLANIPEEIPDDRAGIKEGDKVILIVEDDTAFAKALLEFTRKKGYKGVVAVRGDLAIEFARHFKPLGILLDLQLPVKNGWEVMDILKSDAQTKHIPVHIMSSFEVKRESLLKGAVDFINKPVAFEQMDDIFKKIEFVLNKDLKKVLIIEENAKHAKALAYFLSTYHVNSQLAHSVDESIQSLQMAEIDCVILDMATPAELDYKMLDTVKETKGFEHLPIIIFTGKSLSRNEEQKIRRYADSIVIKTAHSYQRILDEVSLFLHLVTENEMSPNTSNGKRLNVLDQVLRNKVVLIADDDVRNIYSLSKALESHKMKILPATDGREALKQLDEHTDVDIILMDMMMPELDGYEAIRMIKNNSKTNRIPVIAVTAKAMKGDREKCILAGASDYITKPIDIDQLISLLRIWLYDK